MKKTIRDFELNSKRVIIRCDLNVPMKDNVVLDDTRIKSSVRTIKYAIKSSAKVILLSHLGKVKSEEDKKSNSLKPVVEILSKYLNKEVSGVPFLIIGNKTFEGYNESMNIKIKKAIKTEYKLNGKNDYYKEYKSAK